MYSWVTIETDISNSMPSLRLFSSVILSFSYIGAFRGVIELKYFCEIVIKEYGRKSLE